MFYSSTTFNKKIQYHEWNANIEAWNLSTRALSMIIAFFIFDQSFLQHFECDWFSFKFYPTPNVVGCIIRYFCDLVFISLYRFFCSCPSDRFDFQQKISKLQSLTLKFIISKGLGFLQLHVNSNVNIFFGVKFLECLKTLGVFTRSPSTTLVLTKFIAFVLILIRSTYQKFR